LTLRAGLRGTVTLELDDTARYFTSASANVQWFERIGYTYELSATSSPSRTEGGGNCVGRCSNVSAAGAYGDPNTLVTAPQVLLKAVFYAGGDKGT
jgi:hypothetical protein